MTFNQTSILISMSIASIFAYFSVRWIKKNSDSIRDIPYARLNTSDKYFVVLLFLVMTFMLGSIIYGIGMKDSLRYCYVIQVFKHEIKDHDYKLTLDKISTLKVFVEKDPTTIREIEIKFSFFRDKVVLLERKERDIKILEPPKLGWLTENYAKSGEQ